MFEALNERLTGVFDRITGRGALSEKDVADGDSGAFVNLTIIFFGYQTHIFEVERSIRPQIFGSHERSSC